MSRIAVLEEVVRQLLALLENQSHEQAWARAPDNAIARLSELLELEEGASMPRTLTDLTNDPAFQGVRFSIGRADDTVALPKGEIVEVAFGVHPEDLGPEWVRVLTNTGEKDIEIELPSGTGIYIRRPV